MRVLLLLSLLAGPVLFHPDAGPEFDHQSPRCPTGSIVSNAGAYDGGLPMCETTGDNSYAPKTKHLGVKQCTVDMDRESKSDCARLYPEQPNPESYRRLEAGPTCAQDLHESHLHYCQWYGGSDVAEECRKGFHATQTTTTTLDGLPMGRTICVRDDR